MPWDDQMKEAAVPAQEPSGVPCGSAAGEKTRARNPQLQLLGLDDPSPEPRFDRIARLAARMLGAPIALVSLMDDHRQIHKGEHGLPEPYSTWRATPLSQSLCKDVVSSDTPVIIKDAREHPQTREKPAIGELGVIAYIGVPVRSPEGETIGALCAVDNVPRPWTSEDAERLQDLAQSVVSEIALRRQLQESQRLSRQLERFVSSSPAALYIYDIVEKRNVFVSTASAALIGVQPEEIDADPCSFLQKTMHPADYKRFTRYLGRVEHLENRDTASFEYRMRLPDGTWRWFLSHDIAFTRDEHGKIREILGTAMDITERRRAEEALRESEERLDLVLRGAELGTWDWNMLTDEVVYNRRWAEMLGYEFEEIEPHLAAWDSRVHPEDRARVMAAIQEHTSGRTPLFSIEHRLRKKDGSWKWILTSGTTFRDKQGRPVRSAGIHLDIDDRKRAEAAAKTADQQLARILESMSEACAAVDSEWRFTFINPQWEALFKWRKEEVIGRSVWDVVPQMRGTDVAFRCRRAMTVREPLQFEAFSPLAQRWLDIRIFPSTDGGLSTFVRDIHERKLAEAALQEASKRKDEFLAMLGHELRNPLAAMRHALTVCTREENPETFAWAKAVMERQINHLTRLVDELLDVSRITRGKVTLRQERLEVSALLDHAIEAIHPLLLERRHQLCRDFTPGELWVDADPVRLGQIVGNLLTNAAKYTDPGGRIILGARREDSTGGPPEVVISVTDNGTGLPREKLPKVFDLFVQGERTLARTEGGLGLGLAIVKRLTEMHGGHVHAESEGPGKGCTFTIRLPAASPPSVGAPSVASPAPQKLVPHRVLVVDDLADTAQGLARLLRRQGHTVEIAENGVAACEKAHTFAPEVVLLDIGLPGMDGYEVAQHLRHDECCSNAVIIAITGYGQDEDRRRAIEAGFNEHLVKPVDFDRVKAIVGTIPSEARP